MKFIGLDAGSVSVKIVLLDENGRIVLTRYQRHRGRPLQTALELIRNISGQGILQQQTKINDGDKPSLSVTGSAGRLLGTILGVKPVNEVVAFAFATRRLYPGVRTIIELGGEDSKLIILGEDGDSVRDFSMNSVCAAGTGSFLDQQAERLRLSIEEFSGLSLRSQNPPRIAGRCSVFAKSDMIHLQQIATPVEDIVAGLCFAVARNFKGSIARGRDIVPPVSFQGGVAANKGMVRAFREAMNIEDLFVPEEHAFMGAIGAVLKDRHEGTYQSFDLSALEGFINSDRPAQKGYDRLVQQGDSFFTRHDPSHLKAEHGSEPSAAKTVQKRTIAYLGVDIGSISTNLALIDGNCRLLAKRYLMTAGRPIDAVRQGLEEIDRETAGTVTIAGVGTTGSGRYMIADFIGADVVKNEITAQATAAAFIDKDVDTIFEIGGQDSKYISLRDGFIADFEMNKACAAGTGSFLEEQAEKLDISIKGEFESSAFGAKNPCRLGERCTVFMENSLMANLQRGAAKEDLLAGLSYSIVQNYINRVVGKRPIGKKIFFQGGVAFNKSVTAAFEKYLGKEVIVPPDHDVTGAIGMALIAKKHMEGRGPGAISDFKGFELSGRQYEISSFECRGCPNVCEINRVRVEGEKGHLFYGGRCEKYDVRKKRTETSVPDLFAFRDEMLWKEHLRRHVEAGCQKPEENINSPKAVKPITKPKIGIPYIFYFQDFLPFWTTLLWEMGFDVEVSPKTDRNIVDLGLESVLAETCFPVKASLGHMRYLIEKQVDAIFLPSFVNLNGPGSAFRSGFACPYTQTAPYSARVAFGKAVFLSPVIDFSRGRNFLKNELKRAFRDFGKTSRQISMALEKADNAQKEFELAIRDEGKRVLSGLKEKALVIVGRAYNSFDRGMNLNLPKKLADLGVLSIPMDFLPVEHQDLNADWPNMYWRAGQRILGASKTIRANPLLHAVYIGSFSCGPDSFIIKFFEEEMAGKPYLHLEIDAHSADAGAITRCEAFLDSIANWQSSHVPLVRAARGEASVGRMSPRRTIFIPRMSDHALALAAAFEHCGVTAEVLPEPSKETTDLGKKYVSGKECYPCAVTTGDMVRKIQEPGFVPSRSAFFMPSGAGPCRFGQYNVFHRLVIKELGIEDVPVLSPVQDENFYGHLGMIGRDFALRSWKGIVAIELLTKCLHETRPYEKDIGSADNAYRYHLDRIYRAIKGSNGAIDGVLKGIRIDFEKIRYDGERKPLVGIVGEIFVRSNRFSNEELVRKIEALGCEAYLAPVEEWIYYINHVGIRRVLIKKEWSGMISLLLKRFFQKRIEHRYGRHFAGLLRTLHEPDTKYLLTKARPYIHPSFEGEAILSIGKGVDLIDRASGLINAMPFGCMPGTIVSGLMRGLNTDFGIPCLSIPYDGTESLTTGIQLEAFIDQTKEYTRTKRR